MFQQLSKSKASTVRQLALPKYREKYGLYIVEGKKMLDEALKASAAIQLIAATDEWLAANSNRISKETEVFAINEKVLNSLSALKTADSGFAVVKIPAPVFEPGILSDNLTLALEGIRDPGNLGTIIRSAEWFGIRHIICSADTVDVYNPKVIQATMGSVFYVNIYYVNNLTVTLHDLQKQNFSVAIADMQGTNITDYSITQPQILVLGNESNGIGDEIRQLADVAYSIPRFPETSRRPESLNVANAAAILIAFLREKQK